MPDDDWNIFQSDNDRFGRQSMPDCILPRAPFNVFGLRTGAPEDAASIGLYLPKQSHPLASPWAFLEAELPASTSGSRLVPALKSAVFIATMRQT